MSYDRGLDDLMPETITTARGTTKNAYGEVTATGTATTYRARVLYSPRRTIAASGDEVVANGVVWVSGSSPSDIRASDILTLPDGSSPPIIRVDTVPDEDGQHHQRIFF